MRVLASSEYERYVHTFVEPSGNWTYLEKVGFPVRFNESQIAIGCNWSIVCPLTANHSYHVYCYGRWIDTNSTPKTDYDIYVYNPAGELEGYHTEAAGLPEHLGTTTEEPYFKPKHSGNYTFVIVNDAKESSGAEQATFFIVEAAECNVWHEHYVEGKDPADQPVLNTSWAYAFATESQRIEIYVDVPESLDMYEARLYLMEDNRTVNRTILNGVPLAWEPGLYGERNGTIGGYNMESREYRGVAYASCEYYGQDMFINYTVPRAGKSLYHLVLIGEKGNGTVSFLIKTLFGNAALLPLSAPSTANPQNETVITYACNATDLVNATLWFSADDWKNTSVLSMEIVDKKTCSATIPGQAAGVVVKYKVEAVDVLRNVLVASGNYTVKFASALNLTALQEAVIAGENITVKGDLAPKEAGQLIIVTFKTANFTKEVQAYTDVNGTFTASFQTENVTVWEVTARFNGNTTIFPCSSGAVVIKAEEPTFLMKFGLYLGGGIGASVAVVGVIVYFKKFRE
ncbi:MAG: hypothetical protein QXJ02_07420 [Candidatus Bathyarchaeia archaeon]